MRVAKLFFIVGLAALVGGCFAAAPVFEGAPPADETAAVGPDGVLGLSAAADYSYKAELDYKGTDYVDEDGDDYADGSLTTLRFTWYPRSVTDNEIPYALQPYMQRATSVRAGLGTGSADWSDAGGPDDIDLSVIELGVTLIDAETGLGLSISQSYRKMDDQDGSFNIGDDSLTATLFWQNEGGFAAQLGLVKRDSPIYLEELGPSMETIPSQTAYRGVSLGAKKVFLLGDQAVDVSASVEYGRYDMLVFAPKGGGSDLYSLAVTYYPMKMLGIGVSYAGRNYDPELFRKWESKEYGVSITATLAERFDIGLTYRTSEKDLEDAGWDPEDLNETTEFGMTVGVRF